MAAFRRGQRRSSRGTQPTNPDVQQQQLLCLHADITPSFHHDWSSHSSASVKAKELFKLGHHQPFPSDAHPAATPMNSLFMCLSEQAATFPPALF